MCNEISTLDLKNLTSQASYRNLSGLFETPDNFR